MREKKKAPNPSCEQKEKPSLSLSLWCLGRTKKGEISPSFRRKKALRKVERKGKGGLLSEGKKKKA